MATIQVGDVIKPGKFEYVPYGPELEDHAACGRPITLSTNEWKGKKVVIFSVPGAFTPTCHANHLPGYLKNYGEFKAKGIDIIAVVAANDPFVMSGWGRVQGLKDKILSLSDPLAQWSASLGLSFEPPVHGLGVRTNRYALVLDDLVVKYIGVEPGQGVTVSGADAVLKAI